MALGLVVILSLCYFASMKAVDKMDRAFTNDTRALQVVGNTIERLYNKENYTSKDVRNIFMDEFRKGGFSTNSGISPKVKMKQDSTVLGLLRANGKAIIEVNIICQK
jgi:hypothetical protein